MDYIFNRCRCGSEKIHIHLDGVYGLAVCEYCPKKVAVEIGGGQGAIFRNLVAAWNAATEKEVTGEK